jgi:hypothetical protein
VLALDREGPGRTVADRAAERAMLATTISV